MKMIFRKCILFRKRKYIKKGFTLLEVLVVTLIIGVLAAIAIPSYNKSVKKSRVSDALNNLEIVTARQQDFLINNERYADTFAELKLPFDNLSDAGATATIGNFEYTLTQGCAEAKYLGDDTYTIGRNTRNEIFCVEGNCKFISDLVSEGNKEEVFTECGFSIADGDAATDPGALDTGDVDLGRGSGESFDSDGTRSGESIEIDGCIMTCQNGVLKRTGLADGYVWNEDKGKCLYMMCKEGHIQKNTIDGVHHCRTWSKGLWVPEKWEDAPKCS